MDTVLENATKPKDKMNPAKESFNEAINNFRSATNNMKDAARSLKSEASEDLNVYIEKGQEKFSEASKNAESYARENPLLVAGGAFIAGWLLSRAIKRL